MTCTSQHLLMRARRGGPSLEWSTTPAPLGGTWFVARDADAGFGVVAPGVATAGEEPTDARLRWRLVTWPADVVIGERPVTPKDVTILSVADAVSLLGAARQDEVLRACRAMLRHLDTYATTLHGQPDEERARAAAGATAGLLAEASEAFPEHQWRPVHGDDDVPVVPDTAGELLREVDGAPCPAKADEVHERLSTWYFRAVDVYRHAKGLRHRWRHPHRQ